MSERQFKKYMKQHISHLQVETDRWGSQCQTAWCQLNWQDAAAAVEREVLQKHTADPEAVWNSTIRGKIEIFPKKEKEHWRSIFLRPVLLICIFFHLLPITLYSEILFHIQNVSTRSNKIHCQRLFAVMRTLRILVFFYKLYPICYKFCVSYIINTPSYWND